MAIKSMFTKAYLLLLLVFVCIMICFGVFIYQNTAETMRRQLGNKCIGIATAVAVMIEEDIDGFVEFSKNLDVNGDYYQSMYPKLSRIRHENNGSIAFLYVESRVSDTKIRYILDSEYLDDESYSPPGYEDEITASEIEAYRLQAPFIPNDFVTNDYGTLLTCYVPLRVPETGEFLALVGVDVSIDQYNDVMHNQLITIATSILLLILLLILSMTLSSGRMERLVARDNLTGAYNKSHFMRSLRQQLKYSMRRGKPITVFMADLDHFKIVNDTYGHLFGDVVLGAVSNTISQLLRKMDCLARYGGEEFAAYLPDTDIAAAESVVERVRQAVENTKIYNEEVGEYIRITISIGVAQCEPHYSAQELLNFADKALYQAKLTRNATAAYKHERT